MGANSWCFLFYAPFFRASRAGDDRVVIGRRRSTPTSQAAVADHLTHRGGARFQVDDGCKKPTVTSLYTVDPLDPNHDATMRIEGEAPKQQQPILFPGAKTMGGRRATATSDRVLAVSSLCAPRYQNLVFLLPPCFRLRRRMQREAFRYDAVIRIAPQGNDELAGKRYNHRLA